MFKSIIKGLLIFTVIICLLSCGAVPTTRYEKNSTDSQKENSTKETPGKSFSNDTGIIEDFDVSRFRAQIDIKETKKKSNKLSDKEVWYSFSTDSNNQSSEKTIRTVEGYRVLVFSTDVLEELNDVQLRLEEVKNNNKIYTVFEPPFYKLLIGDLTILEDANALRRKLIQLGFKDSKVIRTTVNVYDK
ncbi:MAG: hypothetical protein NZM09_07060 [Ignavibacterium sp.]|nr:hypothetical protein [Ignavibacterium sp.]MDW8375440.1 hypothetical protein [Ignavibacteriales bacterium]